MAATAFPMIRTHQSLPVQCDPQYAQPQQHETHVQSLPPQRSQEPQEHDGVHQGEPNPHVQRQRSLSHEEAIQQLKRRNHQVLCRALEGLQKPDEWQISARNKQKTEVVDVARRPSDVSDVKAVNDSSRIDEHISDASQQPATKHPQEYPSQQPATMHLQEYPTERPCCNAASERRQYNAQPQYYQQPRRLPSTATTNPRPSQQGQQPRPPVATHIGNRTESQLHRPAPTATSHNPIRTVGFNPSYEHPTTRIHPHSKSYPGSDLRPPGYIMGGDLQQEDSGLTMTYRASQTSPNGSGRTPIRPSSAPAQQCPARIYPRRAFPMASWANTTESQREGVRRGNVRTLWRAGEGWFEQDKAESHSTTLQRTRLSEPVAHVRAQTDPVVPPTGSNAGEIPKFNTNTKITSSPSPATLSLVSSDSFTACAKSDSQGKDVSKARRSWLWGWFG